MSIYTSGTTGTPKGVMIEHQQVVAMASAWNKEYGLDQESISWLQWASFAFDVFTGDFVRALLHGGKLVICPSQSRLDFGQIHGLIQQHQIQMFESTPAFVIPLMEYIYENKLEVSSLRTLILGSDQCTPEAFQQLIERYGSQMRILNSYGVTEACIDSSYFETDDALAFTGLPIGKPLPNVQMYVLNENLSIQPVGIVGELFIAGKGVGRGYFNRPELNAEKFVENPFRPEEKMYRTGDLARWLPDGNIEFLGRIDDQVKVRGFRIELGEIESKLLTLDVIKEGAVIAREEESGQKQLYAYVVAEQAVNVGEIRSALSQMLPGYMIPSYFVQVEKMPLTPNGKIDRRALPYIEGEIQTGTEYVAPRTEAEKKLVEIWQEILGVQKISIKENFFDLGGHSLRATTLVSRLHKEMSVEVSLRSIFQFPTVEKLAEVITQLDQT
ncbi:non-ribosomal peptide synthetase, partial [Caldalkalibacillus mannanilyticus]|uniref:non-ribosomal peptide synthetase n=1 Tax=Caldalkalibacillus mannanilyticus TaxID=1418 RepID=UPI0011DD8146